MAQNELILDALATEEKANEEESTLEEKKGCRGCLRKLAFLALIFILALVGFLAWLSGPGFRWAAAKYGPDFLEKSGFHGDFEVSGNLLLGPKIDSLQLTSETSPLKEISARNLRLRYRLSDLLDKKVESITADALTIDLDLSQSGPKKEEQEKGPPKTIPELLAEYRPLATYPEIKVEKLNLHVHRAEQNFYRLQEARLAHESQSALFELQAGTLTDFENQTSQPPPATIVWNPAEFRLTQLPLTTSLGVPELTLQVEPLSLAGQLQGYGSNIYLDTDISSQIKILLGKQALDLKQFLALSPATNGAQGKLSQLELSATGLDKSFDEWAFDLALTIEEGSYQKRTLPETQVRLGKEELTLDTFLRFDLPKQPQVLEVYTEFAPETAKAPATAWLNSTSALTTELASLASFLEGIAPVFNLPTPPDGWPDGETLLLANINLKDGQPIDSQGSLTFNHLDWAEASFERGEITVDYVDAQSDIKADLVIEQSAESLLQSRASFHPITQSYEATFQAENFQAETLQPFIRLSVGSVPLAGTISLAWQGNGNLTETESHRGKVNLSQTRIAIDEQTPIQLKLAANYEGLSSIELEEFRIQQADQVLTTNATWDGERIEVPSFLLTKSEQRLMTGRLSAPFSLDFNFADYFSREEAWTVEVNADRLNLPATADLLGVAVPSGLDGTATLDLSISGSPAQPTLEGNFLMEEFTSAKVKQLPPTDIRLAWATAGQSLTLDGTLEPKGKNALTVAGNTGFYPKKWAENPDSFLDEEFSLQINAPNFRLEPLAEFSPKINRLEGNLVLQARADGTFRTPNLTGSLEVDLPTARFDIERFRKVRQTRLSATFADDRIQISPFATSVDGSLYTLEGEVNLADTSNPAFDLRLIAEKALLWRDDNINSRADARLSLRGNLTQARLGGEIDIVESLFYKDIELLPLNVPVSIPKPPKLPSVRAKKKKKSRQTIPVPEPYANWTLNLVARTVDPFLIRGNLTEGQVVGQVAATGTLANPALKGELRIPKLTAALPFSTLMIEEGRAVFSPENGLIPSLDIRAESRIPPYNVDLFVSGLATSPTPSFASNPPLPENEIMTLLATGTTSAGLEDPDAAKGKAFQFLIEQIRRAPPGSPLHPLAKFAEPLKDIEFQVAGADPFTGKRRNSVTVPVPESDHWFVTASVDSQSNTRGLVLYILKFD